MRFFVMGMISLLSTASLAKSSQVFISFSMPEKLLHETLADCAKHHIPATLTGLVDNSMPKTAERVMVLTKTIPNLALQIDPTSFERFHIEQVPALVVADGDCFDVIYGNLPLAEGMRLIHEKGECSHREAL